MPPIFFASGGFSGAQNTATDGDGLQRWKPLRNTETRADVSSLRRSPALIPQSRPIASKTAARLFCRCGPGLEDRLLMLDSGVVGRGIRSASGPCSALVECHSVSSRPAAATRGIGHTAAADDTDWEMRGARVRSRTPRLVLASEYLNFCVFAPLSTRRNCRILNKEHTILFE